MKIKLLLAVTLALLLSSATSCSAARVPAPAAAVRAVKQTALVKTDAAWGTAVLVRRVNAVGHARWFAWTAAHVVEDAGKVELIVELKAEGRDVSRILYRAKVIAYDRKWDLALLFVDALPDSFTPAEWSENLKPSALGAQVYAVGSFYGGDFPGSLSTGEISQINRHLRGWRLLDQSTAPVYPGSSGGPIFGEDGLLIGIVVARVDATLGFFVPVRAVYTFAVEQSVLWAVYGNACPSDAEGHFFTD